MPEDLKITGKVSIIGTRDPEDEPPRPSGTSSRLLMPTLTTSFGLLAVLAAAAAAVRIMVNPETLPSGSPGALVALIAVIWIGGILLMVTGRGWRILFSINVSHGDKDE